MTTVLRLRPGVSVTLFDGKVEVDAALDAVSEHQVTAHRLGEPRRTARSVDLTLIQGVPRSNKMDDIVRMGTEIGLTAIIPARTERTVADPAEHRVERWRRITREAAKQCGRADLPEVSAVRPLEDILADLAPTDLFIVPWERATQSLPAVASGVQFVTAMILIGPEGGLTEREVDAAGAAGGRPVSLGPLVLRTETAGVVATAMLLYEHQRLAL